MIVEYLVRVVPHDFDARKLEHWLNRLGDDGWELRSVNRENTRYDYVFMRAAQLGARRAEKAHLELVLE